MAKQVRLAGCHAFGFRDDSIRRKDFRLCPNTHRGRLDKCPTVADPLTAFVSVRMISWIGFLSQAQRAIQEITRSHAKLISQMVDEK
jgi:hypothetical protein